MNNSLGYISAKYESGGNAGSVSSGNGDYGGISYGIPQFSSKEGSADSFIRWLKQNYPNIGELFGNLKAGTKDFGNKWKEVANNFSDFGDIQQEYAYQTNTIPFIERTKELTGVDLSRSRKLQELAISRANQHGSAGTYIFKDENGNLVINNNMSDDEIINATYNNLINRVGTFFRSSSKSVQKSVANRFKNEKQDLLNINGSSIIKDQLPSGYVGPLNKGQTYSGGISLPKGNTSALDDLEYNDETEKGSTAWYKKIWDTITNPMKKGVAGIGIALIIIVLLFLVFFALNNKIGSKIIKETKNIDVEKTLKGD